jgi:hypothetical protein
MDELRAVSSISNDDNVAFDEVVSLCRVMILGFVGHEGESNDITLGMRRDTPSYPQMPEGMQRQELLKGTVAGHCCHAANEDLECAKVSYWGYQGIESRKN